MTVIDLKSLLDSGHFSLRNIEGMADECREDTDMESQFRSMCWWQ